MMEVLVGAIDWIDRTLASFDPDQGTQAFIAAAALTALIYCLFRVWRRVIARFEAKLEAARGTTLKTLRLQRMELLSAEDLAKILGELLRGVYWIGVALLVLLNLNIVFGLFPATRGFAIGLVDLLVETLVSMGQTFTAYLPKLAMIVLTAAIAHYAIKVARLFFNGIATRRITIKGFYTEWAMPTFGLVRLLIIAIAFVLILPNLPAAHSPAFRGVSIFVAVLLSLGSTAAVANIISGVVLTYTRAFKIGDRVRIADTLGDVKEKTLFVTRIATPKRVEIAIPNSLVLANHIVNFSSLARRDPGLVVHTSVTIGYDIPQKNVTELLIAAAGDTADLSEEPEPFVHVTGLDDFYISYEINAYTRNAHELSAIYSELHGHIVDRFNDAGIEILSPHYSAIRDGNRIALPDEHLPKDYEPAPFRIHPFERLFKPR